MVKYKRLKKLQWFKQPHPAFSLAPETHEELYSFKFDDSDVRYGFFRQEAICLFLARLLINCNKQFILNKMDDSNKSHTAYLSHNNCRSLAI